MNSKLGNATLTRNTCFGIGGVSVISNCVHAAKLQNESIPIILLYFFSKSFSCFPSYSRFSDCRHTFVPLWM